MYNLQRPENMEMSKKFKKTYLLTVFVSIIFFTLIACIINNCRQVAQDYVDEYKLHIERISNLEDNPLTLAEEFMQTKYDKHWASLGVIGNYNDWRMKNDYELGARIIPERYHTIFTRYNRIRRDGSIRDRVPENQDLLITCQAYANDESEYDTKSIVIAFNYNNSIRSITVYIDYHGDNPAEPVNFNIDLIENEYVADRTNAEELTGLTIEEIVETAELNRKGFEDLMYAMKEHEPEESKNDLNADLKFLYTVTKLQIVALLSLWIIVLVAILKFMTKKKTVATPIEGGKSEK